MASFAVGLLKGARTLPIFSSTDTIIRAVGSLDKKVSRTAEAAMNETDKSNAPSDADLASSAVLVAAESDDAVAAPSSPPRLVVSSPVSDEPKGILTPEAAAKKLIYAWMAFVASTPFAGVSFTVNGVVGIGKCVLAVLSRAAIDSTNPGYKDAQALLEEGAFQVYTAVYDFAVTYFDFIRVIACLAIGFAPGYSQHLHSYIFKPWEGQIEHTTNASEQIKEKAREGRPLLQRLADVTQEALLPSQTEEGYFTNLWRTLQGAAPRSVAISNE